jgi:hypothetical protein
MSDLATMYIFNVKPDATTRKMKWTNTGTTTLYVHSAEVRLNVPTSVCMGAIARLHRLSDDATLIQGGLYMTPTSPASFTKDFGNNYMTIAPDDGFTFEYSIAPMAGDDVAPLQAFPNAFWAIIWYTTQP